MDKIVDTMLVAALLMTSIPDLAENADHYLPVLTAEISATQEDEFSTEAAEEESLDSQAADVAKASAYTQKSAWRLHSVQAYKKLMTPEKELMSLAMIY